MCSYQTFYFNVYTYLNYCSRLFLDLLHPTPVLSLRKICQNTGLYVGRIVSVFSRIWTESLILSKYWKIRIRFCPYTGKYGSKKACISGYFTQCLADILSHNLELHKNFKFCQCAKIVCTRIYEVFNCAKIKSLKRCAKFDGVKVIKSKRGNVRKEKKILNY